MPAKVHRRIAGLSMQQFKEIVIPDKAYYLQSGNIWGCTIGYKYSEARKRAGRRFAVTFFVRKKIEKPDTIIPSELTVFIPDEADPQRFIRYTLPTDVLHINPRSNRLASGDVAQQVRKIPAGKTVYTVASSPGTLGCYLYCVDAQNGTRIPVLMSNAHVLHPESRTGNRIVSPPAKVWANTLGTQYTVIGKRLFKRRTPVDIPTSMPYMDVAVATVTPVTGFRAYAEYPDPKVKHPKRALHTDEMTIGLKVVAYGARKGKAYAGVILARVDVLDKKKGYAYNDVFIIGPEGEPSDLPDGGDSGMVWTTKSERSPLKGKAIGLHFGNNRRKGYAYAIPFDRIMQVNTRRYSLSF